MGGTASAGELPGHDSRWPNSLTDTGWGVHGSSRAPQDLDRVQFRGAVRQPLDRNTTGLLLQALLHQATTMTRQAVPYHKQLPLQGMREVPQKVDHLLAAHRPWIEAKIEVPQSDSHNGRERLPVEVGLEPQRRVPGQDRSLAPWRPDANPVQAFAQPTLVDEDNGSPSVRRAFFRTGQRFSFQLQIPHSSCSRARPVFPCALQPRACRMRQT